MNKNLAALQKALSEAKAAYQAAQEHLATVQEAGTPEEKAEAQKALEQAQSNLQAAENAAKPAPLPGEGKQGTYKTTGVFTLVHSKTGVKFNSIEAKQHAHDRWLQRQIDRKLLIKVS